MQQHRALDPETPPELKIVPRTGAAGGVPVAVVQLAMIFAVLAVLPLVKPVDNDFWWHLRTGQLVLESGIPRHDPFSWSAGGHAWVAHEWLSEAVLYSVESTVGYAGNVVVFAGALIAAMTLMFRLGRVHGAGTRPLVVLTLLSACVLGLFITPRPQMLTFLLFAVFVFVLETDGRNDGHRLYALPPLMALWVNLHLGFIYGLAVVACWLVSVAWERRAGPRASLRVPLLVASACVCATMLNPHGPAILWFPARYIFDGAVARAQIAEWAAPDPGDPFHAAIFACTTLALLAVVSRTRPRPFLLLTAIVFAALAMQALRNAPFVALLVVPVAGGTAARRWPPMSAAADSALRMPFALAVALPLLVAAIAGPAVASVEGTLSLWSPSHETYPAAAVAYVSEHDAGLRVLNNYSDGGYEIAQWYPDTRVFIDGRSEFFGDSLLRDYLAMVNCTDGWESLLESYGPQVVLLPPGTALVDKLRSDAAWRVAFEDEQSVVLERR